MPDGEIQWFNLLGGRAVPSIDISFWSGGFHRLFNCPHNCAAQSGLDLGEMTKGISDDGL